MKKFKSILCSILCLVFLLSIPLFEASARPTDLPSIVVTIYTPHNSSVSAYRVTADYSATTIANSNNEMDSLYSSYPLTRRIASANGKYNCHSYAWYYTGSNNDIWLDYPTTFCNESTLVTGTVQVGDIVVYYKEGTETHSAIVLSCSDGTIDNALLVSKWGDFGVYEHAVDVGHPYTDYTSISVYRKHSVTYTDLGRTQHSVTCSCGVTCSQSHCSYVSGSNYVCIRCGHSVGVMITEPEYEEQEMR